MRKLKRLSDHMQKNGEAVSLADTLSHILKQEKEKAISGIRGHARLVYHRMVAICTGLSRRQKVKEKKKMTRKWIKKGNFGSGSYHGDFHCENPDCPKFDGMDEDSRKFSPRAGWYSLWVADAFENVHSQINGYCSKKCLLATEGGK